MNKSLLCTVSLIFCLSACTNSFPAIGTSLAESLHLKPSITQPPILLIGIGMHIEPQGTTHQGFTSGKGDFGRPEYFELQTMNIRSVVEMVNAHGGMVTVQAQSPYTDAVIAAKDPVLKDLAAQGNEIALHFHEDAHLGKNSENLPVQRWCTVIKEEIDLVKKASQVSEVNYWSGGNLYPEVFEAAECAGLSVNSDWKNPKTQSTDPSLIGLQPWRPAGGTDGVDFSQISRNDPAGLTLFLPEGLFERGDFASMRRAENAGGDEAYFKFLEEALLNSLKAAEAGKVNVFHFTIHPGEFRGAPSEPYAVIEDFLTQVVDPLVSSGKVKWATFSEMAEAVKTWDEAHPEADMRD
jgi:hypothetical protein